jgi:chaperonin GroEL
MSGVQTRITCESGAQALYHVIGRITRMGTSYHKTKSVGKIMTTKGPSLEALVLKTMATIGDLVGVTLGPGGRTVVIERQEANLPSFPTKDGVSVCRALGFVDSTQHCILEIARDAAQRTGNDAGDGTTTSTVLGRAAVENVARYCRNHPKTSPQRVVRRLEALFREVVEPTIRKNTYRVTLEKDREMLKSVAKISANGDTDLAEAVMECYDKVGDEGQVTIAEMSGPSSYSVQVIDGFPITTGYEQSCIAYSSNFINDPANQKVFLTKPIFVLYNGDIKNIQQMVLLMEAVGRAWETGQINTANVVVVATGFSETVLGNLALNFLTQGTINVFPLTAPRTAIPNSQLNFLEDMAALTGARVLDAINAPLDRATLDDMSPVAPNDVEGVQYFEAYRHRSTLVGFTNEEQVLDRVTILEAQLKNAASVLDGQWLAERIGKLTGGIARLTVIGASNGEMKEKRDRAEDAICSVRGAIKSGCLPGGGYGLMAVAQALLALNDDTVAREVLVPSLLAPVQLLLLNAGFHEDEVPGILQPIQDLLAKGHANVDALVYDVLNEKYVQAIEGGILDSAPAVLEAIRNGISIAGSLGTLGGCVVFPRDNEVERIEARDVQSFLRDGESFQRSIGDD